MNRVYILNLFIHRYGLVFPKQQKEEQQRLLQQQRRSVFADQDLDDDEDESELQVSSFFSKSL